MKAGTRKDAHPPPTLLVHEALDAAARTRPDAPAVRDESGRWTYRELSEAVHRAAHWLSARGVAAGDRVATVTGNSRLLTALLYGTLRAGAVFVPLSPRTRPYQLSGILRDVEPSLVVTDHRLPPDVRTPSVDLEELAGELKRARATPHTARAEPGGVALLMHTSGSTALPKGVVCRHSQVAFAVSAIAERLRYRPGDTVYCRPPFSFDYGLYQSFLCVLAGAELALTGDQPEAATLRFASHYRATVLPLLPPMAHTLLLLASRGVGRSPGVRLMTSTGGALSGSTARRLRAAFPRMSLVSMYGMTECKRVSISEPDEDLLHPGTAGIPLDGTEVRIVDEAGRPLAPGATGQIMVSGPHVMDGYWRAPRQTAERFVHATTPRGPSRLLLTGDLGRLDGANRLTVLGRRDNIFKRNGVRTSTTEIEAAALDVPGVVEAVVAPPTAEGGLRLWARSELLTASEVLGALAQRLEPAKVPDRCDIVDRLPRATSGKTDVARLLSTTDEEVR